jgi:hypothetical protein
VISAIAVATLGYGDDDALRKQRLQLMERAIADLDASSTQITSRPSLTFAAKPLLRYSDPTRGLTEANVLLDASVWRLGVTGRPTALVTLEIYRSTAEAGMLAYEFLSLTDAQFHLMDKSAEPIAWMRRARLLNCEMSPTRLYLRMWPPYGSLRCAKLPGDLQFARR